MRKKINGKKENNKIIDLDTNISIMTLNINVLKNPTKRQILQTISCLQYIHFRYNYRYMKKLNDGE